METPEEFAWTLYAEEMDFHDHSWRDPEATARLIAARDAAVAAKALRDAAESDAITIPDALGYKVQAVAVEDLLDRADAIEREAGAPTAPTPHDTR